MPKIKLAAYPIETVPKNQYVLLISKKMYDITLMHTSASNFTKGAWTHWSYVPEFEYYE